MMQINAIAFLERNFLFSWSRGTKRRSDLIDNKYITGLLRFARKDGTFKKRYILYIITIVMFALPTSEVYALSPKSALKKLNKHYRQIETLQTDFTEQFEWAMTGETVTRMGTALITSGNRFRIETAEQLIVSDGINIFRHNIATRKVIIESVAESSEQMLPRHLMLDFTDKFNAVEIEELPVSGQKGFRLDMLPKNAEEVLLVDATIWASEEDLVLRRFMITDLNGNTTTYTFKNIRFDQPIDPSQFYFTLPEDAELFDLR